MKLFRNKYLMTKLTIALVSFGGLVAFAAENETLSRVLNSAGPNVKVQISGGVHREDIVVPFDKAGAVKKGDLLDWNISSTNEGASEAQEYRVVGQIPSGTTLIDGTATGDQAPEIKYSIDGGKTYSATPMIDEKQPDGTTQKVAAPVSYYTQVMFQWKQALASQANLNSAYSVRVK